MSGPEISWHEKSILGCGLWPGLDCGKKGSGPIMSNFWGPFVLSFYGQKINLKFFWKYCRVRTEKLHRIKVNKSQKFYFFLTPKKWKNGPHKNPFISQSSPDHSPMPRIDLNLGTRHLFSYLWTKHFDSECIFVVSFFRAKNLSVNTWRSGPDICSLICVPNILKQVVSLQEKKYFGCRIRQTIRSKSYFVTKIVLTYCEKKMF